MNIIKTKERIYAEKISPKNLPNPNNYEGFTAWFGKEVEALQGSIMYYPQGKQFRTHKHIMNPRIINRTQEVFIVIEGKIIVDIYEKEIVVTLINNKETGNKENIVHLGSLTAKTGEAIFVWAGFHKVSLKGIAYEIKAGNFNGIISDDKEFINE